MHSLLLDVKYGIRMLLNKPGFAAVAVITLALGIGANTAIFSVVNAVLLRPLPYRQPGKLVRVYTEFPTMNLKKFWMSPPEFLDIQNEAAVLGKHRRVDHDGKKCRNQQRRADQGHGCDHHSRLDRCAGRATGNGPELHGGRRPQRRASLPR